MSSQWIGSEDNGVVFAIAARDRARAGLLLLQVDRLVARGDVRSCELWAGPALLRQGAAPTAPRDPPDWRAAMKLGRPWLTVLESRAPGGVVDIDGIVELYDTKLRVAALGAAGGAGGAGAAGGAEGAGRCRTVVCSDDAIPFLFFDVPGFARLVRRRAMAMQQPTVVRMPMPILLTGSVGLEHAQAEWCRAKVRAAERAAHDVEIVVARFNEDVGWLREEPFASLLSGKVGGCRVRATVYDKGASAGGLAAALSDLPCVEVVPLHNEGREAHSFLTHVVERHTNGLAEVTVFLMGSCMDDGKRHRTLATIQRAVATRGTVLLGHLATGDGGVRAEMGGFSIDRYSGSCPANGAGDGAGGALEPCRVRPFGAWWDAVFPELPSPSIAVPVVCWHSVFAASRRTLERHPAARYERVRAYLEGSSAPEAAHYVERAWGALLWPHNRPECVGRV